MKGDNNLVTKKDLENFGDKLEKDLEKELTKKLSVMIDVKLDSKLNEIRDDMKQWHSDIPKVMLEKKVFGFN